MARVTVEDCIDIINNRFELVMLASQRARSLSSGAELTVERDNDKNPVIALREIAESKIDIEEVKDLLVVGLQKHVISDEPDEDDLALLSDQEDREQQVSEEPAIEPQLGFSSKQVRSSNDPGLVFDDDVMPVDTNIERILVRLFAIQNPILGTKEKLLNLAEKFNLTATELALSFVNNQPFVASNIIGATNLSQLEENIKKTNFRYLF